MDTPVSNIMEKHVVSVDIDDTIEKVQDVFDRHRISCLPVIGGAGRCFGVITLADLTHFHADHKRPGAKRAWEVCTHKVVEVTSSASVREVAKLMVKSQIHHVLVVEKDKVVGVVSSLDLVAKYVIEKTQPNDSLSTALETA